MQLYKSCSYLHACNCVNDVYNYTDVISAYDYYKLEIKVGVVGEGTK